MGESQRHWVIRIATRSSLAPAAGLPEAGEKLGGRFLFGGEVIGGHQLDRKPRQDTLAAVLSPIQHHPAEGEIIIDR